MGNAESATLPPDASRFAFMLKRLALKFEVSVFATCCCTTFGDPRLLRHPAPGGDALLRLGGVGLAADIAFCLDWYSNGFSVDAAIVKNRRGTLGRAKLAFVGEYARFMDRVDDADTVRARDG